MSLVNQGNAFRAILRATALIRIGHIGVGFSRCEVVRCKRRGARCAICRNSISQGKYCLERYGKTGKVRIRLCSEECWQTHDDRVWRGVSKARRTNTERFLDRLEETRARRILLSGPYV